MPESRRAAYDSIVIGSGFGGAMVARELVGAGERVLLVERGGWLARGPHLWDDVGGFFQLTPAYTRETAYEVEQRRGRGGRWKREREGICACVGGPSLFYGGASFRFREADFRGAPEIVGDSDARWPFRYATLEPFYGRAERVLGIAGEAGLDPTEPPRSSPYPQRPAPLSPLSRRVSEAASRLGLNPFPIPLALNHGGHEGEVCASCTTCDAYACAIGAKNDLATRVIAPLLRRGLEVRCDTVVTRLVAGSGRVEAVEAVDRTSGERLVLEAGRVVLSAGALASPHLLLASGLERWNPGGHTVGRFLMRHCNAFVYGVFAGAPNRERLHHKQVAIHDFYLGDPAGDAPAGKLGNLQQIMAPQTGAALRWAAGWGRAGALLQRGLAPAVRLGTRHMTGLQVIAEDQPREENRVELDWSRRDRFGLPQPRVRHQYTERDLRARRALVRRAGEILREAGARVVFPYPVTTFSHAVGTVRMGTDADASALDEHCRFRGLENLFVVDGSFMPTSAGVNPSLTIAANALRVGAYLARGARSGTSGGDS